jgi:hypothetical protein
MHWALESIVTSEEFAAIARHSMKLLHMLYSMLK